MITKRTKEVRDCGIYVQSTKLLSKLASKKGGNYHVHPHSPLEFTRRKNKRRL